MTYNRIKSLVGEELKSYFRPEFLNRLDEIIVFRQLTKKVRAQAACAGRGGGRGGLGRERVLVHMV